MTVRRKAGARYRCAFIIATRQTTDERRYALFDDARVSIAEVGYSAVSHADITAAVAIGSADVDLSPPL